MGADRAEAGGAINVQSNEEEVSDPHELLRAGGGDGRAGAPPDTADLRESAQIRGEVAVLGNLTYLEVRNMEALQKEIDGQAFTDEDTKTLDELGI